MTYKLWEILERANSGPFSSDEEFNVRLLIPCLRRIIKERDIRFDRENVVPQDDSLADDVWEAGLELFLEVGSLNIDTHRRLMFEEKEIREALYSLPGKYEVGRGLDSRIMAHRDMEDRQTPFCIFSPDITCTEELFLPMSIVYLNEPLVDGFCAPILEETLGTKIRAGAPSELAGSMEHALMLRQACMHSGKPGCFLVAVGTAESDVAQVSVSAPWGVRPTDGRLVGSLTELKTSNQLLNKIAHLHTYGCCIGSLTGPIFGGYAGGAEGTAIMQVAYHIKGLMVDQAHFQQNFPFHIYHTCNTTRELLWAISVSGQAIARNTKIVSFSNGFAAAGSATEMVLLEGAAHALASTVCGYNLWELAVAKNKYKDRATPLEARLACEVGHAVSRMDTKRKDVNDLVLKIVERYEDDIANAPLGQRFQECYDTKKLLPTEEHLRLYRKVRSDLEDIGIEFPY
jgi:hypothetical protein